MLLQAMCSVTSCHGAACHAQQQRGATSACKPFKCQVCCSLSKVVRGERQLNAAGAAAAPGSAASGRATHICDAVPALEAATRKTRCPVGTPHEPFMQGGLFEAAVCILIHRGHCSLGSMP